jgi:hypothetical protein
LWGIALTILGYTIKKRTEDKHAAAGEERSGLLEKLMTAAKRYMALPKGVRPKTTYRMLEF